MSVTDQVGAGFFDQLGGSSDVANALVQRVGLHPRTAGGIHMSDPAQQGFELAGPFIFELRLQELTEKVMVAQPTTFLSHGQHE